MVLQGKSQWVAISVSAVVIATVLFLVIHNLTAHSSAGEDSRNRWFVCAETRKPFKAHIEIGESTPIMSPFSHKPTGYEAELCFWTKEGTIKSEPTPVLLNSAVDPRDKTPTFCPDCGRLVVGHNPAPVEGHAPPTREEWMQKHGGTASVGNSGTPKP